MEFSVQALETLDYTELYLGTWYRIVWRFDL